MLHRGALHLLIVGLALLASHTGTSPVAAAGATYVVDDDLLQNCVKPGAPDYNTITDAVAAADNGDTIRVCEGDYTESSLVITASLTITGPGATKANDGVATVHHGGGGAALFTINSDGVTIEGLDLDLTPPPSFGPDTIGIGGGGDYVTIRDNEIRNASRFAVWVGGVSGSSNVNMLGNNVHDNAHGLCCDVCDDSGLWSNTVDGAGSVALSLRGDRITIGGNVVTNGEVYAEGHDVLVQNNQISAGTGNAGLWVWGDPVTVTNNDLSDASAGIMAGPWHASTSATIGRNTFTQVNTPIRLWDDDPSDGFTVNATIGGSPSEANTFVNSGGTLGDSDYLVEMQGPTANVNAEHNNWGLCTAAEIEQEIYHQVDDPAQGLVDFEPFIAPDSCAAPTPSPSPTPTPTPTATTATPTPTATGTPTPTGTRAVTIPARSWANFAWTGDGSPQEVANCYNDQSIAVMYRLDAATQVFEGWFRGAEALSTMGDVAELDALLAFNASDQPATCTMPDPAPVAARTLTIPARGWANFAWTGDGSPQEVVNCYNDQSIAVMYRLDAATQVFEGWFRGAEALSTMGDVAPFDALLAFNASAEVASCTMAGG